MYTLLGGSIFPFKGVLTSRQENEWSAEKEKQLIDINNQVNSVITYKTDFAQYRDVDKWVTFEDLTKPNLMGDCEDYVLTKIYHLKKVGINGYMILCKKDEKTHAVCGVDTPRGTYILCNTIKYPIIWEVPLYKWFG